MVSKGFEHEVVKKGVIKERCVMDGGGLNSRESEAAMDPHKSVSVRT